MDHLRQVQNTLSNNINHDNNNDNNVQTILNMLSAPAMMAETRIKRLGEKMRGSCLTQMYSNKNKTMIKQKCIDNEVLLGVIVKRLTRLRSLGQNLTDDMYKRRRIVVRHVKRHRECLREGFVNVIASAARLSAHVHRFDLLIEDKRNETDNFRAIKKHGRIEKRRQNNENWNYADSFSHEKEQKRETLRHADDDGGSLRWLGLMKSRLRGKQQQMARLLSIWPGVASKRTSADTGPSSSNNSSSTSSSNSVQPETQKRESGNGGGIGQGEEDKGPPILISKVEILCDEPELVNLARSVNYLRPNFSYHTSDVQDVINRFGKLGVFSSAKVNADDTRDGTEITFLLEPNEKVVSVVVHDASIVPVPIIQDIFRGQFGKTLNRNKINIAREYLQQWYDNNLYYAKVIDICQGGVVEFYVNELSCSKINLKCVEVGSNDNLSEAQMQEALRNGRQPLTDIEVKGNLKKETLLREMTTTEGSNINGYILENDRLKLQNIEAIAAVELALGAVSDPMTGKSTVELLVKYGEQKCRTYNLGGGLVNFGFTDFSFGKNKSNSNGADNFFENLKGNFSFIDRCLFGRNEIITGNAQLGVNDISASIEHRDNWVPRDAYRTNRVSSLQTSRSGLDMIHGPMDQDDGGDSVSAASPTASTSTSASGSTGKYNSVFVEKFSGGIEYGRRLTQGWSGNLGLKRVRSACIDTETKQRVFKDQLGCPLSVREGEVDKTILASANAKYSSPYNPFTTISFSMQQTVPSPIEDWNLLQYSRLSGRLEHIIPIAQLINKDGPVARLELAAKGGAIFGDLPSYDAFSLGGPNTVRGWNDGAMGTARHYAAAMGEFVCPAFNNIDMVLFCDYASDFESGTLVPGDPAGIRGKPGSGIGYGAGLRLNSMMGPIRVEYAFNGKGLSKSHFHFGKTF